MLIGVVHFVISMKRLIPVAFQKRRAPITLRGTVGAAAVHRPFGLIGGLIIEQGPVQFLLKPIQRNQLIAKLNAARGLLGQPFPGLVRLGWLAGPAESENGLE